MEFEFDWDDANRDHLGLHGISPVEAEQVVCSDPIELGIEDHPADIVRTRYIGETRAGRILIILITWRGDLIRVISGWDPPKSSKTLYLNRKVSDYGAQT
jgi:uncharacterized DUF497 family protein